MAVSSDGPTPLYLQSVHRILREMRMEQQDLGTTFSYATFKKKLRSLDFSLAQLVPLNQRIDTLEGFMPEAQTQPVVHTKKSKHPVKVEPENVWALKVCNMILHVEMKF